MRSWEGSGLQDPPRAREADGFLGPALAGLSCVRTTLTNWSRKFSRLIPLYGSIPTVIAHLPEGLQGNEAEYTRDLYLAAQGHQDDRDKGYSGSRLLAGDGTKSSVPLNTKPSLFCHQLLWSLGPLPTFEALIP